MDALSYDIEKQTYLTLRLFDPQFRLLRTIEIELPGLPTTMHDFIITEWFVVLCHGPVGFDWAAVERGESPLKWTGAERGAQYGIMPKDGDANDLIGIEGELHFVFHFANAFERFDDRRDSLPTRYVYSPTGLGEPVFVPRPEGTEENDGWVPAFVYHEADDSSALILWDARNISDGLVCKVEIPRRVSEGLHGSWLLD